MRMVCLIAVVLLCTSCTVTFKGSGQWSNPEPVQEVDAQLRQKHEQLSVAVKTMTDELGAVTNELGAVNAVLRKYGIPRPSTL